MEWATGASSSCAEMRLGHIQYASTNAHVYEAMQRLYTFSFSDTRDARN